MFLSCRNSKTASRATAAPRILIVNVFSPAVFAMVVDRFGWQISLYALLGCSMMTWIAIELMSRWYEGAQSQRLTR